MGHSWRSDDVLSIFVVREHTDRDIGIAIMSVCLSVCASGRSPLTQCWRYRAACDINTFFSETRVQVRPVDGFLRAIAH